MKSFRVLKIYSNYLYMICFYLNYVFGFET